MGMFYNLKTWIEQIREEPQINITLRQKLIRALIMLGFGLIMGILAKYVDGSFDLDVPSILIFIRSTLGEITTDIGIWIFIATCICVFSRSPRAASLNVFLFFMFLLIAYYIYSGILFGFFSFRYFKYWAVFAVISLGLGYIIWYARGTGWIAAFIASIPVLTLLKKGQQIFLWVNQLGDPQMHDLMFRRILVSLSDIVCGIILFIVITNGMKQKYRTLTFVIGFTVILQAINYFKYM